MLECSKIIPMLQKVETDIVIFGGGIAGLYTLNRLRQAGYSAILLETDALGAGQTSKAQGIIHGGIKFALNGLLNPAVREVADMPNRWQANLQGCGDVDLRAVKILSQHQLLWSQGYLRFDISTFLASKLLKSRVQKLNKSDYPGILQGSHFKGTVYQLQEMVLDLPSLLQTLSKPCLPYIFKIDPQSNSQILQKSQIKNSSNANFNSPKTHFLKTILLKNKQETVAISAQHFLLTAGAGNAQLSTAFQQHCPMQTRPLHMVLVKLKGQYPLFAHCIEKHIHPRITITTPIVQQNHTVWYLGGQLAEKGVQRDPAQQWQMAAQELQRLFPHLDLSDAEYDSFYIDRAEPVQKNGKRPDSFFLQTQDQTTVAWPTKLALAPKLADHFMGMLNQNNIQPAAIENLSALSGFEKPGIAKPIWQNLFQGETEPCLAL